MQQINTLVVEADAMVRLTIVNMLKASAAVNVVGIASDAMLARMQAKTRKPDLIVVSLRETAGSADALLEDLHKNNPTPVLLLSNKTLPQSDAERQLMRSQMGAILVKPASGITADDSRFVSALERQIQQLLQKTRTITARQAPATPKAANEPRPYQRLATPSTQLAPDARPHRPMIDTLIAIGASTGGTEALRRVVCKFPADRAAVAIVQHIPKPFAASFIEKLDQSTKMKAVAVEDGLKICHGYIYVGACDQHFRIEKRGTELICRLGGQDKVSGHCPSVDVLFDSIADQVGSRVVAALMTGMGEDGARGLKKIRERGAKTVAQDKASSVVWGMPGSAVKMGAADEQVSLDALGDRLQELAG